VPGFVFLSLLAVGRILWREGHEFFLPFSYHRLSFFSSGMMSSITFFLPCMPSRRVFDRVSHRSADFSSFSAGAVRLIDGRRHLLLFPPSFPSSSPIGAWMILKSPPSLCQLSLPETFVLVGGILFFSFLDFFFPPFLSGASSVLIEFLFLRSQVWFAPCGPCRHVSPLF